MKKIDIFLKQINADENLKQTLENVNLDKVEVSEQLNVWKFIFSSRTPIDCGAYFSLINQSKQSFPYDTEIVFLHDVMLTYTLGQDLLSGIKGLVGTSKLSEAYFSQMYLYVDEHENQLVLECATPLVVNYFESISTTIRKILGQFSLQASVKIHLNEQSEHFKHLNEQLETVEHSIVEMTPKKEIIAPQKIKKGRNISKLPTIKINHISQAGENVAIEGYVFDATTLTTKNGKKIQTVYITDYSNSVVAKRWLKDTDDEIDSGLWYKLVGKVEVDTFRQNELTVMIRDFEIVERKEATDTAKIKRIQLHAHTHMSTLDGVTSAKSLIKKAIAYGHEAIAITDTNSVQSFPEAYYASGKGEQINIIYGAEVSYRVDAKPFWNVKEDIFFRSGTFVVFDLETTGLHALSDEIIEIGAVKIENGRVVDELQLFVKPNQEVRPFILELTHITIDNISNAQHSSDLFPKIKAFIGDATLVAHNAQFDISFLNKLYVDQGIDLPNAVIDTIDLAKFVFPEMKRYGLKILTKKLGIEMTNHHRAIYDAQATASAFLKMVDYLELQDIQSILQVKTLMTDALCLEKSKFSHLLLLVKNEVGLKNLFKIISEGNTTYFSKKPKTPLSYILENREGLLIGSSSFQNQFFQNIADNRCDDAKRLAKNLDFIELQPDSHLQYLVESGEFSNFDQIIRVQKKAIEIARETNTILCGSAPVYQLEKDDTIFREIYVESQKGVHPLNNRNIKKIPAQYFMTTDELFADYSWLNSDEKLTYIIENPQKISESIENITIIKDELFTPKMENDEEEIRELSYKQAIQMYGNPLPELIAHRLEKELNSIIGHGFSVIYLISQRLVKKSMDDGYIVGSRGSVGSSVVAFFLGISEVNPLPTHYYCPNCQTTEFSKDAKSGFDLKDKKCPNCNEMYKKDGQDIPFETFLGFEGDKVPDIDLNFSGEYQARAHAYTKELFGEDKVYRAGTIGTVASKTAFGYVNGYLEDHQIHHNSAEVARLVQGCEGVKRTTGQHPGGIVVVPDYMDIYDITPIGFPADDVNSEWKTTHFDFHAIHDNLLKLDILGHDNPTIIKMLEDLSGIKPQDIPLDDPKVYSIFGSNEIFNVTSEQILTPVGTYGIPEFGTKIVRRMLAETKPKTFTELVQISGLSHGTDVWNGNAQDLIQKKICTLDEVIGCRDDIMVYLMEAGLKSTDAFNIMESVRKGKGVKDEWVTLMKENNVPNWYIESCQKIKYMFPKAHAAAYVTSAMQIAYFKVHYPLFFYASFFSIRANDFDLGVMYRGGEAIREKIREIEVKQFNATVKEKSLQTNLELALEMCERGFIFEKLDLNMSHSDNFTVTERGLIPPFRAVEGLGDTVAKLLISERDKRPFISKEDMQKRTKMSKTILERLNNLGILDTLEESNQLSLF